MRFQLRLPLFLFVVLLALSGCGTSRESQSHEVRQDQSTKRTTTTATKTVAGDAGPVVAEVVQTVTLEEFLGKGETSTTGNSTTTLQLPPVLEALPKVVMGAASAATGGIPWGEVTTGVIGALSLAWAAHKHTQANQEKRRADYHQVDADDSYNKLEQALRKAPPEA